ncbi:interferon-induced, double-stranded RNA-activated protein kinase-like [Mantella aurantiaca]
MGEENFKGQLISYCVKLGLSCRIQEVASTGPSHDPRFTYHVFVNDKKVGEGEDKKKKAASNIAAKMALLSLQNQEQVEPFVAPLSEPVVHPKTPVSRASTEHSPVNGAASIIDPAPNYVGKFNEYCQKNGHRRYNFVDDRRGPDHIPEFFCKAIIDDQEFPEAKGKNKKEAKKNAAFLALKVLKKKNPTEILLQKISERDDADGTPTTNAAETKSADNKNLSLQTSEKINAKTDSSDLEITFHPSFTGTPCLPNKPLRRIAANFSNQEQGNENVTKDILFLKDFDNITRLDSGGYGTVFKARKKLDHKDYAVKKIKWRSEKDVSEVQTLARLQHPHIVRYYHSWTGEDSFSDNSCSGDGKTPNRMLGCLFIQMEWCAKGTLESWIYHMEKVDKVKSLEIFQQIVDGVEYIHSEKLIHRDLKPANILFAEDMVVKIADFGLVTSISEKLENDRLLRTAGKGTESYMAPEQENNTYENEVDIFPLGLILIELFWKFTTGHAKQKEWKKLRNADLSSEFVAQYPSEESVIKLMLSKDPHKRPRAAYLKKYFESKSVFHSNTL